jgi:hypothetical protein
MMKPLLTHLPPAFALLFLILISSSSAYRDRNRERGPPSSYQQRGGSWRNQALPQNQDFSGFEQISGQNEQESSDPFRGTDDGLQLVDEDEGAIQQSQNFNSEEVNEFSGGLKQGQRQTTSATPKYFYRSTRKPSQAILPTQATTTPQIPLKYEEGQPEVTTNLGTFVGKKIQYLNQKRPISQKSISKTWFFKIPFVFS